MIKALYSIIFSRGLDFLELTDEVRVPTALPKKNLQKGLTRKPQSLILNNVDKTFPDSSMVEHSTVNRVVVSSSLTRGAN